MTATTEEQRRVIELASRMTPKEQVQLLIGMLFQLQQETADIAGTVMAHTTLLGRIQAGIKRLEDQ